MHLAEFFGYLASVLVFVTFYMKAMVRLRYVAIASNLAFITYAILDSLTPILILHVALLPLNVLRLLQIRDFIRQVELAARESFSAQAIVPLMQRRKIGANEKLFSIGDPASELFYVADGRLLLPELQHELGPGSFLGEFALFSESGTRTASAVAQTDCTLMVLSRSAVFSALLQHPRLGIHLLKLITARLMQNAGQGNTLPDPPVAASAPSAAAPRRSGLFSTRGRRLAMGAAAVAAFVVLVAVFHPRYVVFNRDAVVTAWANVATAPIAGTVQDFEARPGQRMPTTGTVARIVNPSADRSSVISAQAAAARADTRLEQLTAYNTSASALSGEPQGRLEQMRTAFALREAEDDAKAAKTTLAAQEKNFDAVANAALDLPAGMTVWTATAANGAAVARGERLFTWVDCAQLLVEVPVSKAMATLAVDGTRAEITLENETVPRQGAVTLNRQASTRLMNAELVGTPAAIQSDAQVLVAFADPASVTGCPIGRRAFVRFPDISLARYIRALFPPLR